MSTYQQSSTLSAVERTGHRLLSIVDRYKGGSATLEDLRRAAFEHAESLAPWIVARAQRDVQPERAMTYEQGQELLRLVGELNDRGARMMGEIR